MYNILLVDDDTFFASIFASNFDWEANGFGIVGHAENGVKAIEMLHRQRVDLAFVDMCMPGMNGPELISYISQNFAGVSCVALSNYDDFDFVKESFRAGANDYVLKHCLNRREMQRILTAYLERCGESAARLSSAPSQDAVDGGADSASHYLAALLEGRIMQDDADYSLSDALKLPRLQDNLLVICTQIPRYEQFRQKYAQLSRLQYILRSMCSILRNILERHAEGVVFFHPEDHCLYSILTDKRFSSLAFLSHTQELYTRQVESSLKMYFNIECTSAAAPLVANVRDLRYAYLELHRTTHGGSPVTEENPEATLDFETVYTRALDALKRCLLAPDFDDARRYIARCYEDGRRLRYGKAHFMQLTVTLYRVYLVCLEAQIDEGASDAGDLAGLFAQKNVREMEDEIVALFSRLYDSRVQNDAGGHSSHVLSALETITRQYSLPSLSLNVVADAVHVSAPYLSRSFKTEMHMGISEYINRFRIERAQALFTIDTMSVKTVATRCGFDNYTYFFKIFKKYTGMTPGEFYEKHGVGPADGARETDPQ